MELWQLLVAVIQGLVEWLPISSEGQVVLFLYSTGAVNYEDVISLAIWLHLGTTMAVVARYPRDIVSLVTLRDRRLLRQLLIATAATAAVAIPLYFTLRTVVTAATGDLLNMLVGGLLIVTALMLYLPGKRGVDMTTQTSEHEASDKNMLLAGLAQGFSVLPGLSRSGLTISALLMQRIDKNTAFRLSFIMSVPAVLGILGLEVLLGHGVTSISPPDLMLIIAVVFFFGLLSMEALIRLAARVNFWRLCLILGAITVAFGLPALL
ncbi:MAG: undecaprenyl-diphosphate phosphatase [Candidatus Thorarchaeota archaeon]|nr:undecaprenyl-diphosphate phosphatase [Candidatus Thorarchaeota archaeon]